MASRRERKSFIKVVDKATIRKMKLPSNFLTDYGHELGRSANLLVPNGCIWKIGLRGSGNNISFNKNWADFIDHYRIKQRYRLVMDYIGSSTFKVCIFGGDTFEIKYPSRPEQPSSEDEGTIELSFSSSIEDRHSVIVEVNEDSKESVNNGECSKMRTSNESESEDSFPLSRVGVRSRNAAVNNLAVISAAEDFRCRSRHPSFKIVMRKYYIERTFVVPRGFSKMYLKGRTDSVQLQLSDGRNWVVSVKQGRVHFGAGWQAFKRGNHLKLGDVCVFELVENYVMKVSIFRD